MALEVFRRETTGRRKWKNCPMMTVMRSAVNSEVEERREGNPQCIGREQHRGGPAHAREGPRGDDDGGEQQQNFHEGERGLFQPEENRRPRGIERKLDEVERERPALRRPTAAPPRFALIAERLTLLTRIIRVGWDEVA
jgi:hypothetical protein